MGFWSWLTGREEAYHDYYHSSYLEEYPDRETAEARAREVKKIADLDYPVIVIQGEEIRGWEEPR